MQRTTTIVFACLTTLLLAAPGTVASEQETEPYPGADGYEIPPDHSNVIVTASDYFWGKNVAMKVCAQGPDGEEVCSELGCGGVSLLGLPFSGGEGHVLFALFFAADDGNFCGATTGTITYESF